MRFYFLFFVLIQFSMVSLNAMESCIQREPAIPSAVEQAASFCFDDYYQQIIDLNEKFHDIRRRIIVLLNGLNLFIPANIWAARQSTIQEWLDFDTCRIDGLLDQGRTIQQRCDALQASSTDGAVQQGLMQVELMQISNESQKIVAGAKEQERLLRNSDEMKPLLDAFHRLSRQRYFQTLANMTQFVCPEKSIIAYLIGARGYPYQEIPAFLKRIAREHPRIPIIIYSIGEEFDKEPSAEVRKELPCESDNCDNPSTPELSELSELYQLMQSDQRPLSAEQEQIIFRPLQVYRNPEWPNLRLVSCCMRLPLAPDQAGYQFFKRALQDCIKKKLDCRSIVFIGNNTECYSLGNIPLISEIYYNIKHRMKHPFACNLQLYTQRADGQCIVYDPIRDVRNPVTIFYDHSGKLFVPARHVGLFCAATPCDQFLREDGLRYHLQDFGKYGMMITHVSSRLWERPEIVTTEGIRSRDPRHVEAPQLVTMR